MQVWAGKVREWFVGKKTTLGGCLIIAATVGGVATGSLSIVDGITVVGFGFSICGWSAKANRHQSELLSALESVAAAGVDLRTDNKAAAIAEIDSQISQAIALVAPTVISAEPAATPVAAPAPVTAAQPQGTILR